MKLIAAIGTFLVALAVIAPGAQADTVYVATGSNGIAGSLYTVNPVDGASTLVGPLLIGADPIGLTALAFQPSTGILFGVTGGGTYNGATHPHSLVTIDPTTAAATLVGTLTQQVGDLAFAADGTLYGWGGHSNALFTIDPGTAAESEIGSGSGITGSSIGASLSFVGGTLYVSSEGDTDGSPLRTVDLGTGVATTAATLTGAPRQGGEGGAINAMATSSGGVLFGVDSDRSGSPAGSSLVTIDTATGVVSTRGDLPGDTDALAFQLTPSAPAVSGFGLLALFAALGILGVLVLRMRH